MNTARLKALLERHESSPFPTMDSDNEAYGDWLDRLAEIDPYYVGLAISLLNGEKSLKINFSYIEDLKNQLHNFSSFENSSGDIKIGREYLNTLNDIVELLKNDPYR